MQSSEQSRAKTAKVASSNAAATKAVTGPPPVAPELLQFIGGGKGAPSTSTGPTAPKNTW